ncbi:MAG: methyltransferase domain-containing protein [Proteobacteria bacterium]|nr:methyltransferase domain-containing protein [Pseudomonadota bacterium]
METLRALIGGARRILRKGAYRLFPSALQKRTYRRMYDRRAKAAFTADAPFMNYGYVPLTEGEKLTISSVPQQNYTYSQFSMQMYHHLASQIDVRDVDVLEVGCGRGGGCQYIKERLKARHVTGIDLSGYNIRVCRRNYRDPGLRFLRGDAENLPFPAGSFAVVVNVESSYCYPRIDRFFAGVHRVLRAGGHFLYADLRFSEKIEELKRAIENSGLRIMKATDITANVVESLHQGTPDREAFIRRYLARDEGDFAKVAEATRLSGTKGFQRFQRREELYMSFLIQKTAMPRS